MQLKFDIVVFVAQDEGDELMAPFKGYVTTFFSCKVQIKLYRGRTERKSGANPEVEVTKYKCPHCPRIFKTPMGLVIISRFE